MNKFHLHKKYICTYLLYISYEFRNKRLIKISLLSMCNDPNHEIRRPDIDSLQISTFSFTSLSQGLLESFRGCKTIKKKQIN